MIEKTDVRTTIYSEEAFSPNFNVVNITEVYLLSTIRNFVHIKINSTINSIDNK